MTRHTALLAACTAAAACTGAGTDGMDAGAGEAPALTPRPGVEFDPGAAQPGTEIAGLTLESIAVEETPDAGVRVGTARFGGAITLRGATMRHPDYPEVRPVCFEADDESAARLPRWAGDERRAWFCFENTDDAVRSLAVPGEIRSATVTVDRFTIHRGTSDEVNTARLARVLERAEPRPAE